MKTYTVGSGDTISRIVLREFAIDNVLEPGIFDCLIRYVSVINGKNLDLYDNINTNQKADPDTLKVGDILVLPETLNEAFADPVFQSINNGNCGNLVNVNNTPAEETTPTKMKLWPVYAGLGLLALLLLTRKKKKRK